MELGPHAEGSRPDWIEQFRSSPAALRSETMIAFLDVHYQDDAAFAAVVLCDSWDAAQPTLEKVVCVGQVAAYESGNFYKRELPCLLAALHAIPHPNCVVVDGNVWLDGDKPGLGAYLYEALKKEVPVIGIA